MCVSGLLDSVSHCVLSTGIAGFPAGVSGSMPEITGLSGVQGEGLGVVDGMTELQKENARAQSQMLRLRTDITTKDGLWRPGETVSASYRDRFFLPLLLAESLYVKTG